jgi:hypothetical protein
MGERRSPQEKKILSYQRDQRNVYGASPHAARKGIRRRKAWANRTNRRDARSALRKGADVAEDRAGGSRVRWVKTPDQPLASVVDSHRPDSWGPSSAKPSRLRTEALRRLRKSGKRDVDRWRAQKHVVRDADGDWVQHGDRQQDD